MRRPNSALSAAIVALGLSTPVASAQQLFNAPRSTPNSSPSDANTPAFDAMASARGARHLLRNGTDYLGYKEYARALRFLRAAEARQAELDPAERKGLRVALDQAQRGLREAGDVAARGRARRPGAIVAADSPTTPENGPGPGSNPARANDGIQLAGATRTEPAATATGPGSGPGAAPVFDPIPPPVLDRQPVATALTAPPVELPEPPGRLPEPLPAPTMTAPRPEPVRSVATDAPTLPGEVSGPAPAPAPLPDAKPATAPEPAPTPVPAPSPAPTVLTLEPLPEPPAASSAPAHRPVPAPAPVPATAVELPGPAPAAELQAPATPPELPPPADLPTATAPASAPAPKPADPDGPPTLPDLPTASTPTPAAAPVPDATPVSNPAPEASPVPAPAPTGESDPLSPAAGAALKRLRQQAGTAPIAGPSPVPEPTPAAAPALAPTPLAEEPKPATGIDLPPLPTLVELPAPMPTPTTAPSPTPPTPMAVPEPTPEPQPVAASEVVATAPSPAPVVVPAATPTPATTPAPVPALAAEDLPALPGAGPSPSPSPRLVSARDDAIPLGSRRSLSPALEAEIARIAQRQDETRVRPGQANPLPASPVPTPAPAPGDEPITGISGGTSTRFELSRAPSPTEAWPIRRIPVPEEFVPVGPREWSPARKYWQAPALCHMPLYFQDAALERYGHSVEMFVGPAGRYLSYPVDAPRQSKQRYYILQPIFSAGLFAFQIAALPYNMLVDPPGEAEYDLGYYRPGDRIPTDTYYLPLTGVGPPLQGRRY